MLLRWVSRHRHYVFMFIVSQAVMQRCDILTNFGSHFVFEFWVGKIQNRAWHGAYLESAFPNCVRATACQKLNLLKKCLNKSEISKMGPDYMLNYTKCISQCHYIYNGLNLNDLVYPSIFYKQTSGLLIKNNLSFKNKMHALLLVNKSI